MTDQQHIDALKTVIARLEKELHRAQFDVRQLVNMLEDQQQIFIESMREKYNGT